MGMFKKLLGGNAAGNRADKGQAEQFDQEWFAALNRFQRAAGFKSMRLELKHPTTLQIMRPHEGLGDSFADWKKVQSVWDRRQLFFDLILNTVGKSMNAWQIANIFVALRHPDKALELLRKAAQPAPEAETYAEHCEAYARAYEYLQQPNDALEWARKANQSAPSSTAQIRLADVLYMTGACDEADQIYTRLMQADNRAAAPAATPEGIAFMFTDVFALETGSVPSPVLAVEIGEKLTDPQQAMEFWQLGEAEFYDSAYFRMHHAYWLIKQSENPRALAKLIALVQEMPWLREASLNLEILFRALDPSGAKMMPEFQKQLRQTIANNQWTTEGMWEIKPNG